jgi:hypothetical protein
MQESKAYRFLFELVSDKSEFLKSMISCKTLAAMSIACNTGQQHAVKLLVCSVKRLKTVKAS